MREWLTVIIVLLILGILLDGLRRMRQHRRESLRLSRRAVNADRDISDLAAESAIEFPRSKARVVGYRDPDTAVNVNQHLKENHAASKLTRGAPRPLPEQVALNLRESVPMLMESVNDERQTKRTTSTSGGRSEHEPSLGSLDDLDAPPPESLSADTDTHTWDDGMGDEVDDVLMRPHSRTPQHRSPEPESAYNAEEEQEEEYDPSFQAEEPLEPQASELDSAIEEPEAARDMPDEVLIINVMARRDQKFTGEALLQGLLDEGLRFGEMDIFHRHESPDGHGKILFSVANMVVPGTFDLATMEQFDTPGVSIFLSLPIAGNSLEAYNLMAQTAQNLAAQLGGELKDENRSVMTRQTIEHGRQRVIEYERKRRLAKA